MNRSRLRRMTLAVAIVGLLGFATGCPDDDLGDEIENEIENIGAVAAPHANARMATLDRFEQARRASTA